MKSASIVCVYKNNLISNCHRNNSKNGKDMEYGMRGENITGYTTHSILWHALVTFMVCLLRLRGDVKRVWEHDHIVIDHPVKHRTQNNVCLHRTMYAFRHGAIDNQACPTHTRSIPIICDHLKIDSQFTSRFSAAEGRIRIH